MEQDNRERLLAAATKLFADSGFDNVSIRAIASEAQANSALISYYFGSKQQLYDAVILHQIKTLEAFLSEDFSVLDPREVFRRHAAAMQQLHHENPALLKFICREFGTPSEHFNILIKKVAPRLYAALADALQRGIQQGLFRPDLRIRPAIILWMGMVNFYYLSQNLHSRVIGQEQADEHEDTYLQQALQIFLQGLERRN